MNNITVISNVPCYEKDGTAYLELEAVARGLGFTKTDVKFSETGFRKEYVRIDWPRVNKYLAELGFSNKLGKGIPTSGYDNFSPEVAKDSFIPENIFYRLAMKAKNETAEKFQAKVADEIIPTIRKHGAYMTPDTIDRMITNPEFGIKLLTALKDEQSKNTMLSGEVAKRDQIIAELNPKATYYDLVLQCAGAVSPSKIAKDYGKSAIWLNEKLRELGVQYKQGKVWLLYQKYASFGYTQSKTFPIVCKGGPDVKMSTYWTQKGRLFIYELLKSHGIIPLIEQGE